ncbi:MAG: type II toxin-antitoxin system Phd/YefM family antitoxin [Pontiellaceae bacterium]|nr:type II toxin-antitoxin system Phd/YefM family antitoxin [Pontiellaceae bacterium]
MVIQENMHYAKTHFSELVQRTLAGDEVVIAKAGKPLVQLIPYSKRFDERVPGSAAGQFEMSSDFDNPLSDEELEAWGL